MKDTKIYGGLIAFAMKQEDLPQIGQILFLESIDCPNDPKAFGVNKGKGIYLAQKKELLDQCQSYNLAPAESFFDMFKGTGVNAKVIDNVEIVLSNGRNATVYVVEADAVEKTTKQTVNENEEVRTIIFTGNNIKYPKKKDLYDYIQVGTNPEPIFSVIKQGTVLFLMWNGEKVGENSKAEDVNLFKQVGESEITVKYAGVERGLFSVEVNLKDLALDVDSLFSEAIKRVVDEGIETEESTKKYIGLMSYYGLEPEIIKSILAGWKKYDEEGESLIPSIDAAVKVINKKTYYSYIDNCESIHDLAAWTLCGTPLRLIGEMSTGKNLALKTLATIFRRPYYRLSCDGNIDESTLLGNTTLKDGVVTFEDGLPIKAAKKGYWVILDEVNAAPADALIALHSLLENEDGTITIKETGKIVPSEDYRIFATMNANNDDNLYAGTKNLNGAFESRWTTISLKNQINIKEILKNKCVGASDADINKVALVYNSLATIVADPTTDFPSSFIAMRAYVDILNGPSQISLKGRCIQKLANINTNDASYEEIVLRTIDDIFGK